MRLETDYRRKRKEDKCEIGEDHYSSLAFFLRGFREGEREKEDDEE